MLNYYKGPMLCGKYIWIFIMIKRDEIFLFYTLSYNVK